MGHTETEPTCPKSTPNEIATLADKAADAASELNALGDAVLCTPLAHAPWLERVHGTRQRLTLLKLKSEQTTGSFKVRGAIVRALAARHAGHGTLVAAPTDNHALSVAHAAHVLGMNAKLFVPVSAARCKLRALADATSPANGTADAVCVCNMYRATVSPPSLKRVHMQKRYHVRHMYRPTTTRMLSPVRARSAWKWLLNCWRAGYAQTDSMLCT